MTKNFILFSDTYFFIIVFIDIIHANLVYRKSVISLLYFFDLTFIIDFQQKLFHTPSLLFYNILQIISSSLKTSKYIDFTYFIRFINTSLFDVIGNK